MHYASKCLATNFVNSASLPLKWLLNVTLHKLQYCTYVHANTKTSFECHTGTNKIKNSCPVCVYISCKAIFAHLATRCEDIPLVNVTNSQMCTKGMFPTYLEAYNHYVSYLIGITASYFCFIRDNQILSFKKNSCGGISLMIPEVEFLDINLTKGSSLLLHAIHRPFYGGF